MMVYWQRRTKSPPTPHHPPRQSHNPPSCAHQTKIKNMSESQIPATSPGEPTTRRNRLVRLGAALVMAVATGLCAWQFLYTVQGQNFDALTRYALGRQQHLFLGADTAVLQTISLGALLSVTGVVVLVAVIRRRWQLGARVLALVAGANLTTQALKHLILDRPDLGVDYPGLANSLPSGHTTVAMTAALALLMVTPSRARDAATFFAWITASFVGISVMLGQWHRLGDVITAILIAGIWAVLLTPREDTTRRLGTAFKVILWTSIATFILGFAAAKVVWRSVPKTPLDLDTLSQMASGGPGIFAATASVLLILGYSGLIMSLINTQART